jgi:hypothetical protein
VGAVQKLVGTENAEGGRPARFWPFGTRAAVLLVPVLLILLLVVWGVSRDPLHFDKAHAGWVLLGIVLLSVLPLLLVVLESVALSGGSIEVGKVKFALTAAATAQSLVVATRNVAPGASISDTGSAQIIDGLRRARSARIVVVNLEDGHAWWESRLLILCAGAVRLGRPLVIVFTAMRSGRANQFVGWGHPTELLDRLLDANPDYARKFEHAMGLASAARQEHSVPRAGAQARMVPQAKSFIVYPHDPESLNPFLEEQLLADALGSVESPPREIGLGRLHDLFDPVLHIGRVDRTDLEAEWFKKALRSDEEYVAVTDSDTYVALMTRDDVISEVLLAVTGN